MAVQCCSREAIKKCRERDWERDKQPVILGDHRMSAKKLDKCPACLVKEAEREEQLDYEEALFQSRKAVIDEKEVASPS